MDLGLGKLRRSGLNTLHSALHPEHGLAWTDGRCVHLVTVSISQKQVTNAKSIKLGEFDHVESLHWSSNTGPELCYLCVVHLSSISLWKVDGCAPHLTCKQVRKIHAAPIPQGCLWNPKRDILCVLSKEQCTFYFKHSEKRGSFSLPPIESGRISCGCWMPDGNKLLVGMGSIVLIYQWPDIDRIISDYTIIAWKVPRLDCHLCLLTPVSENKVVAASHQPLETLCKKNGNLFDIPDPEILSHGPGGPQSRLLDPGDNILKPEGNGTSDSPVLSLLFNLPRTAPTETETPQLVLFELREMALEPCKLDSVNISHMLASDLLCTDDFHSLVVLGCSLQNELQVYKITNDQLKKLSSLSLGAHILPKGVCAIPLHMYAQHEGVFVMTAQQMNKVDHTFVPGSPHAEYDLHLQFKSTQDTAQNAHSAVGNGHVPSTCNLLQTAYKQQQHVSKLTWNQLPPQSDSPESNWLRSSVTNGHAVNRPGHFSSSETISVNSESGSDRQPTPKLTNLALPGQCPGENLYLQPNNVQMISSENGACDDMDSLEVEIVDFDSDRPRFNNHDAIQQLQEDRGTRLKTASSLFQPLKDTDKHMATLDRLSQEPAVGDLSEMRLKDLSVSLSALSKLPTSNNLSMPGLYSSSEESHLSMSLSPGSHGSSDTKGGERSTLPHLLTASGDSVTHQVAALEEELISQGTNIETLQRKMDKMTRSLDQCTVGSSIYPPASQPEILYLKLHESDTSVSKAFLLDRGRLQLDSVKQAFGLVSVELIIDGVPCVLSANAEGYIPMQFTPRDTMMITGKRVVGGGSFC